VRRIKLLFRTKRRRFLYALKTFIGTLSVSTYISGSPALSFTALLAGGLIDLFIDLFYPVED